MPTPNSLEILEDIIDSDAFVRLYPSFKAYWAEWVEFCGESSGLYYAKDLAAEFYCERVGVADALHTVLVYKP